MSDTTQFLSIAVAFVAMFVAVGLVFAFASKFLVWGTRRVTSDSSEFFDELGLSCPATSAAVLFLGLGFLFGFAWLFAYAGIGLPLLLVALGIGLLMTPTLVVVPFVPDFVGVVAQVAWGILLFAAASLFLSRVCEARRSSGAAA